VLYILDHCPKLTTICPPPVGPRYIVRFPTLHTRLLPGLGLDEENIDELPHLCPVEGTISIDEELSLEQLQAKLPNLKDVVLAHRLSSEYVTKFCHAFPLLIKLWLPEYPHEEKLSEEFVHAISSLQHLRILTDGNFTDEQTCTIIQKLPNLEEWSLWVDGRPSAQTLLSIGRMSKLKLLGIHLETVMANMDLFTSAHEFSMLKKLGLYGDSEKAEGFAAGLKFANSRSELDIEMLEI